MTPAQLATLKTELATDPTEIGLVNDAEHDAANADLLNTISDLIQIDREYVSTSEFVIALDDYASLGPANRDWLDLTMRSGSVRPALVRSSFDTLFANTATQASYTPAFLQKGTRGQQIGVGYVTPTDVANARIS